MENPTSQVMKMKQVTPPHLTGAHQTNFRVYLKKGGGLALHQIHDMGFEGECVTNVSQCTRKYLNLNILTLNCCGLKQRLNSPESQDLVKKHDIVCLQETLFITLHDTESKFAIWFEISKKTHKL